MTEESFSDRARKTHVVYLHETKRESWARDIGTFVTVIAFWSFGFFVGSAALEWLGVFLALLFLGVRAAALMKGRIESRMTPKQAREWLDENFPEELPQ